MKWTVQIMWSIYVLLFIYKMWLFIFPLVSYISIAIAALSSKSPFLIVKLWDIDRVTLYCALQCNKLRRKPCVVSWKVMHLENPQYRDTRTHDISLLCCYWKLKLKTIIWRMIMTCYESTNFVSYFIQNILT